MSRLEKTLWQHTSVSMDVIGSVNIPEISGPPLNEEDDHLSPTLSVDSGRSTSTELWPSPSYLLYGGPGFSIAVFDSITGGVSRIPVPVPLAPPVDSVHQHFSLSKITALTVTGESQVWAGTETGSLHVLDLMSDHRFQKHSLTNLPDPVTCILSRRQSGLSGQKSRVNVIIGGSNGNLTILSGQANERMGLKNSLKCPRKLVQLGGFEEGGSVSINCVTLVMCDGVEMCWCGCGPSIVVLHCSDWKELVRLDACGDTPPDDLVSSVEVTSLLSCEGGVWSTLSHSSSLTLWDKNKFSPKIKINCCNSYSSAGWLQDQSAQISALSYSYPLLFVGTGGGHLMVFRIDHSDTEPKVTHRLVAGTHCGSNPVISIHPTPPESDFPSPATPTPAVNVLVVCGNTINGPTSSQGQAQLYELITSPYQSPLTSPMNITGRLSTISTSSYPSSSSLTLKRSSISECGSLPPLSLAGASRTSTSLLPLRAE